MPAMSLSDIFFPFNLAEENCEQKVKFQQRTVEEEEESIETDVHWHLLFQLYTHCT